MLERLNHLLVIQLLELMEFEKNFVIEMPDSVAAMTAGLWDWDHGDLVDRTLAAIAKDKGLTLIHTDKVLKNFTGFPQKWCRIVAE